MTDAAALSFAISEIKGRLCIVTHVCRKNDGQGRVNYEIVKAALTDGWHVTFVGRELAEDLAGDPRVDWIEIDSTTLPTNFIKYQIFAWRSARYLRRAGRTHDIIHVNGFITWHEAQVNTAHFVHGGWLKSGYFPCCWWRSPYQAYQHFFTMLNTVLEKWAFRRSRAVIAVSTKIAGELQKIGVPRDIVSVIPNGVDLEEFRPGLPERARFGLPEGVMIGLFAGDIRTPRKNLDTVLRALSLTHGIHLAVAGRLEGSPFPALAAALGVTDRVSFLDMVSDMPALMRSVDYFLFPSRYEAMSLVLLEAMASGLPVLTAQTAGGAEIIGDGGRVMADPDDAALLAAWMAELAADVALRQAMGGRARDIAESYSWAAMGRRYLELYQQASVSQPI